MFIFNRPLRAVAAGCGVALLFVWLDRVRQPPGVAADNARVANTIPSLESRPALAVSSAPVRDHSPFLPPAARLVCELASECEKPNRSRPGGSACTDDSTDLR